MNFTTSDINSFLLPVSGHKCDNLLLQDSGKGKCYKHWQRPGQTLLYNTILDSLFLLNLKNGTQLVAN